MPQAFGAFGDEPRAPASTRGQRERRYGAKFASGFLSFYKNIELTDCTVVGPDGREYELHGLLLAYHSEFFRRALSSNFREGSARRIVLGFEDAREVWPTLIEYFYTEEITLTDSNVLALFAASRELLIPAIQEYCADFAQHSLQASNAIQFLSQAVQYNCEQFRTSCVTLVAQSFNTCCTRPTDGLPVEVILEILTHPQLHVQTEEQVLSFVLAYVRRHALEEAVVRQLFSHVRLPFLSNDRLAQLAGEELIPKDLLLAAMAQRLQLIDHPERMQPPAVGTAVGAGAVSSTGTVAAVGADAGACSACSSGSSVTGGRSILTAVAAMGAGQADGPLYAVPRKTYCCTVEYGLPGGSEYVSIPMESVWEDLVSSLTVRVSGDTVEGDPESVLRTGDDTGSWFTVVGEDPARPVWVELVFPSTMRVVELTKYTFSHGMNMIAHMFPYGISDSSWFQMKGLSSAVSPVGEGEGEAYTTLRTGESCQQQSEFVVTVDASHARAHTWRHLRISAGEDSGPQRQARLSIRKLRLYGRVEVSLTRDPVGRDVVAAWRRRKEATGRHTFANMLGGATLKRIDTY